MRVSAALAVTALSLTAALPAQASSASAAPPDSSGRHVLLISVDGLHNFDLRQWVEDHPGSHLAALEREGTTYTNAHTSKPSDSFPGLLSMTTGGTPKSTGVFYDDSYSRALWAPGSNCAGVPGTEVVYAENIDRTAADGTTPLFTSIDPAKLPMGRVNGACVPIYPHSFLKVNTIFNVAHNAHLHTAWSDKHPAYEIVNGPSGDGVDDLFTPEINNESNPTGTSVAQTAAYDQIKVQAVLNEIDGKASSGTQPAPVPAIFGMNFQAVSVGEKLVDPVKSCARNTSGTCDPGYVPGGYLPGSLKFTPQMAEAMTYVDGAIGSMADELRARGLMTSTELIITAKHGQSPIDPAKLHKIGDPVSQILTNAGIAIAQNTTDDIALVWLKDQRQTAAAVAALEADKASANTARIQYILAGDALADRFGDPRQNDRTPDLIVQPIPGTIYTTSKAKVAEHGGFAEDDTHVALLVVNTSDRSGAFAGIFGTLWQDIAGRDGVRTWWDRDTVSDNVQTTQIAPTILRYLGLDPRALDAVRIEGTRPLPRR